MSIGKGRRWLLASVLLAAAVVVGLIVLAKGGGPRYEGRSESYWLKEYSRPVYDPGRKKRALVAFQALGTNAGLYLVAEAFNTRKDSAMRTNLFLLFSMMPEALHLPEFVSADDMRYGSSSLLKELKPPAQLLLTLLEPHWKGTNQFEHTGTLFLLGTAGEGAEQAVPWLIAGLNEQDVQARMAAMQSLGWIGPAAGTAVPALIRLMQTENATNYQDHWLAINLGKIGSNAAPAVPLVRELFDHANTWEGQCSLAGALMSIDGSQTDALNFLIDGLTNHQPASERYVAAGWLGAIGPPAKAAVPVLLGAIAGTNATLTLQVPEALQKMGVAKEEYLPLLKQNLKPDDDYTSFHSARKFLEIDPADHDAHVALMGMIQNGSSYIEFAIETLGYAGPAAAEAIPVLRAEAAGTAQKESAAAKEALRRIEAKPGRK